MRIHSTKAKYKFRTDHQRLIEVLYQSEREIFSSKRGEVKRGVQGQGDCQGTCFVKAFLKKIKGNSQGGSEDWSRSSDRTSIHLMFICDCCSGCFWLLIYCEEFLEVLAVPRRNFKKHYSPPL